MSDITPPNVPSVTMGRLLGQGAAGQVWSAIDAASGEGVAVKILDTSMDETRSRATGFGIDNEHLVRLFRVGELDDGRTCIVMEHCPGGSLAGLVTHRGPLDPGEVVTVLAAVASALAALHAADLVHADVSPGNVMFTAAGLPLLGDLDVVGRAGEHAPESLTEGFAEDDGLPLSTASDLYGLGALGWFMLTGAPPAPVSSRVPLPAVCPQVPSSLADLIVKCLGPTLKRPSAGQIAGLLATGDVAAEPVRLVPAAAAAADPAVSITARLRTPGTTSVAVAAPRTRATSAGRQGTGDNHRARATSRPAVRGSGGGDRPGWRRGSATIRRPILVRAGLIAAVVLLAAVMVGYRLTGTPSTSQAAPARPSASPTATVAASDTDPAQALQALNRARVQAISTLDPVKLASVDAPGSPALAHDTELLAALRTRGVRLEHLTVDVLWTTVRESTADRATVLLSSAVGAHEEIRAADGQLVRKVPRGEVSTVVVQLVRRDGRWWVHHVVSAG